MSHYDSQFFLLIASLLEALSGVLRHLEVLHRRSPLVDEAKLMKSSAEDTDHIGNKMGNLYNSFGQ
jgi:hypothetical protein